MCCSHAPDWTLDSNHPFQPPFCLQFYPDLNPEDPEPKFRESDLNITSNSFMSNLEFNYSDSGPQL